MAHKNAEQVSRLILALNHEQANFYVRMDIRCNINEYKSLNARPRVYPIKKRFQIRWASFRFVEAIVQSVREILASGRSYDFINLLSGQDYPIKPVAGIHQFFAQHIGYSFLSAEPQGLPWWFGAIKRIEQYHSVYYEFKGQYRLQRLVNTLLPKRSFPLPYPLYGSANSSWWTISAQYLINFMDKHPKINRFGRFTWGSDEFIIATILMNSPFKSRIINENYRYIDWSAGGTNPKVLTMQDAANLAHSSKIFARKFDSEYGDGILNYIDHLPDKSTPERLDCCHERES